MLFKQEEAEKKKSSLKKTVYTGPVIRFLSRAEATGASGARLCHNYLTFTETDLFLGVCSVCSALSYHCLYLCDQAEINTILMALHLSLIHI